jgi:hypothetical protein
VCLQQFDCAGKASNDMIAPMARRLLSIWPGTRSDAAGASGGEVVGHRRILTRDSLVRRPRNKGRIIRVGTDAGFGHRPDGRRGHGLLEFGPTAPREIGTA